GWAFIGSRQRGIALRALAAGLALVLLLPCARRAGLIAPHACLPGTAESPGAIELRLTHSIRMPFAALLFAWLYCSAATRGAKFGWGGLGVLAAANIMLMVEGATGYILLVVLVFLFGWQRARWRGISIAILSACLIVAALSAIPGSFQTRVKEIFLEFGKERTDHPASTSTGYRLEFYRNTLTLIGKNPVFGTGTGSFPAVYADLVADTGKTLTRNPHNE